MRQANQFVNDSLDLLDVKLIELDFNTIPNPITILVIEALAGVSIVPAGV